MPERDCTSCTRQDEWGCTAKQFHNVIEDKEVWVRPAKTALMIAGKETYNCPRQTLRENGAAWNYLMMFYRMYQKGYLPDDGGVTDQSNRAIQAFLLLDEIHRECDEALREKDARSKGAPRVLNPSRKGRR